jgi:hypothetical protein
LVVTTLSGPAALLRNAGSFGNHWVTLKLEGTRGNRDGFGAHVRVTAGGRSQSAEYRCPTSYVFQQDSRLHFGLGAQPTAERIDIRWPSGQTQSLTQVAGDRVVRIRESEQPR